MIAFEFDTNAAFVRCVLLHQAHGQLWDGVANAWTAPPADGTVPVNCILAPAPFAAKGPLMGLWRLTFAADVTDLVGASLAVFFSDATGKLGTRIDYFTSPFLAADPLYAQGGWTRT